MLPSRFLAASLLVLISVLALTGLAAGQESQPAGPDAPQAPISSAFTYQGSLHSGSAPADGPFDFQFALYSAASGGSPLGPALTLENVAVAGGIFTVQLDFGAAPFDGQARWLEVGVRPGASTGSYTTLLPRHPLTAVPYALYATRAPWSGLLAVPPGFADGVDDAGWSLTGNAGTTAGTHFLGTTDNQALELKVNGQRALRLEPVGNPFQNVNVIGGCAANAVASNFLGATIAGGGEFGSTCGGTVDQPCWNRALAGYAAIGGGLANTASGGVSTVAGGQWNTASAGEAAVGGGYGNSALGDYATVAGGFGNTAGWGTMGGGDYSAVPGGRDNLAYGEYSFAAGRQAKATQQGAFVWADSTNLAYDPWSYRVAGGYANSFNVRATGGVFLVTGVDSNTGIPLNGMYLMGGGSGWNTYSDRSSKENVRPVDGRAILDRLASIPIRTWNYKTQASSIRHIGPMAQDFHAAFAVGEDEKTINSLDADGVALAAIQGLYAVVQEKDTRIAAQDAEIAALKAQNAEFAARLAEVEARLDGEPPSGPRGPWGWLGLALAGLVVGGIAVRKGGRHAHSE